MRPLYSKHSILREWNERDFGKTCCEFPKENDLFGSFFFTILFFDGVRILFF